MSGQLQIYTGDGKGKTTAAIGLAVRSVGADFPVAFIQFDKGHEKSREEHYSERIVLRRIPGIDLYPTGAERIQPDGTFRFGVTEEDRTEALRGLKIAKESLLSERYRVVVLDDIIGGISYDLIKLEEVIEIINIHSKNRICELIMTGRNLPPEIAERADLITEMKKIKHYFDLGVQARRGIEF